MKKNHLLIVICSILFLFTLNKIDAKSKNNEKKSKTKPALEAVTTQKTEGDLDESTAKKEDKTEENTSNNVSDTDSVNRQNNENGLSSESLRYNEILEKTLATKQDLIDLILMHKGDFAKYSDAKTRKIAFLKLDLYDFESSDTEKEEVTRGEVSAVLIRYYNLPKGVLFGLTGLDWYAIRQAQKLDVMAARYSKWTVISGIDLIGVMNDAEKVRDEKDNWGKKTSSNESF